MSRLGNLLLLAAVFFSSTIPFWIFGPSGLS